MFFGVAGMFVLLLVMMLSAASSRNHLDNRLNEAQEMMAASIQNDMNKVLRAHDTIDHKSADLSGDILPTMKQHMYAANEMNKALTETFGEEYSMIDPKQYEEFLSIMEQFDHLLAAGQSTAPAKESLVLCMDSMETALANRLTAEGNLLPKTASTSMQPH